MLARFFGVAYTAVQAPLGSRAFFSFRVLSFILLMPEDVQKLFVDDFVKGLFALIAIGSQVAAALHVRLLKSSFGLLEKCVASKNLEECLGFFEDCFGLLEECFRLFRATARSAHAP